MQREPVEVRPGAIERLAECGCHFPRMHGEPYMWETQRAPHRYRLEAEEVEGIRLATEALHEVALAVAEHACDDEEALELLALPPGSADVVRQSWASGQPSLYQRMDLVPGPDGQLKLLEYNADTPTGLVEMHCYLRWLEDAQGLGWLPAGADQFNDVRYALCERLAGLELDGLLHVSAARGLIEEIDTVRFIGACAEDVGVDWKFCHLDEIGVDEDDNFADGDDHVITDLFKLYPWEDMVTGPFAGPAVRNRTCRFIEPAWKLLWSNKAFLVLAWRLFPGHPNLLPAFFENDREANALTHVVRKPQWGREGQNSAIVEAGKVTRTRGGAYADNRMIVQQYVPLPRFDDRYPVFGSWVIDGNAVGLLVREDTDRITGDMATCAPHYFVS